MKQRHNLSDIAVLLILAALAIAYAVNWYSASSHILNTILVLPLTVLILICCAIQFFLTPGELQDEPGQSEPAGDQLLMMALFAAYVISLNWLGFDAGTFLFLTASLWLHGERRWLWLIGYAFAFASLISVFFSAMLPYPMPMLILSSAY